MRKQRFKLVTWKHLKSGGQYHISSFSVRESDLVPLVNYTPAGEDTDGRTLFTREAEEFFDGRFVVVPSEELDFE